jgi:hypothetical protein
MYNDNKLDDSNPNVKSRMVTIDPKDLIGRTFLKELETDGQRFRARVVCAIVERKENLQTNLEYMKFICEITNTNVEVILTYNEILDHIEKDNNKIENDTEQLYTFRRFSAHQGPLRSSDKSYKGSTYNVLVKWETVESTYEPLGFIGQDDPMPCAQYAQDHNILETTG